MDKKLLSVNIINAGQGGKGGLGKDAYPQNVDNLPVFFNPSLNIFFF